MKKEFDVYKSDLFEDIVNDCFEQLQEKIETVKSYYSGLGVRNCQIVSPKPSLIIKERNNYSYISSKRIEYHPKLFDERNNPMLELQPIILVIMNYLHLCILLRLSSLNTRELDFYKEFLELGQVLLERYFDENDTLSIPECLNGELFYINYDVQHENKEEVPEIFRNCNVFQDLPPSKVQICWVRQIVKNSGIYVVPRNRVISRINN